VRCGWYNRWWHRRLRAHDRAFMLMPLAGLSASKYGEGPRADRATLAALRVFWQEPGQGHWSCACGAAERADLERQLRGAPDP